MKHLFNVIKDVFDPRDHIVAPNRSAAAVKVSFRNRVPYIKDQGSAGSCTAHAGTRAHGTALPNAAIATGQTL